MATAKTHILSDETGREMLARLGDIADAIGSLGAGSGEGSGAGSRIAAPEFTFTDTSGSTNEMRWDDPPDPSWELTVLVRGSEPPANPWDGEVVLVETAANSYSSSSYLDSGLSDGNWHYALFAVGSGGAFSGDGDRSRWSASVSAGSGSGGPSGSDDWASISWADSPWSDVSRMLQAHYSGTIDVHDYWSVKDARRVDVSSIPSDMSGTTNIESHEAQTVEFVLADASGYELDVPAGSKTRAAFVVAAASPLGSSANVPEEGPIGDSMTSSWEESARRSWLNGAFLSALDSDLRGVIRRVKVQPEEGTPTADELFLPALAEVSSDGPVDAPTNPNAPSSVWSLFDPSNGASSDSASGSFWLRTPHGASEFYTASPSGGMVMTMTEMPGMSNGILPCFCI